MNHDLETTYALTIDYSQTLEQMVEAGNYDTVTSNISGKNFPVDVGDSKVEAVLVRLDRELSIQDVLDELSRRGLWAATMAELLAFGAQHPDSQRRFPIVALGSVWIDPEGGYRFGCHWENPGYRQLHVSWFSGQWDEHCRFLAVRKPA